MNETINARDELDDTQQWRTRVRALLEVMVLRDEQQPSREKVMYLESLWAAGKLSNEEYEDEVHEHRAVDAFYDELQREQFAIADMSQRRRVSWMGRRAIRSVLRPFQSR